MCVWGGRGPPALLPSSSREHEEPPPQKGVGDANGPSSPRPAPPRAVCPAGARTPSGNAGARFETANRTRVRPKAF